MAGDGETPFHERARAGPAHRYVVALREAFAPARSHGATQAGLARFADVVESTVSKYLRGERIAPAGFVDALQRFVPVATNGAVIPTAGETQALHRLRRQAQAAGPAKSQLEAAREEIKWLQQQLKAAEDPHLTEASQRVRELEAEVADLKGQLRKVHQQLQTELRRSARAELESSLLNTVVVALNISHTSHRPPEEIAGDEATARELLLKADELQKQVTHLVGLGRSPASEPFRLPGMRERDTVLFGRPWPVRIYTTASTTTACAVLIVNVASFVATWRGDEGLTIGQLLAYVILVFPVALCLWGLLTASALFIASAHSDAFGDAALAVTTLAALAALVLGISGPFFLPPLTWIGHAWALYIGII